MLPHGNTVPLWKNRYVAIWQRCTTVGFKLYISPLGFFIDSNINNMIAVIYLFEVFIVVCCMYA